MASNSEYPVEIDLGREIKPLAPMPATANGAPPKKAKSRKSYPTVYLNGIEGLRNLPKDGVALIHFHRNRIGIVDRENDDNGPMGNNGDEAEIEIRKLCLPEDCCDDGDDMQSALQQFAKGAGVDTGREESNGKRSDDDDDEE